MTQETIRRDLNALDDNGLIRRVHGGAIPAGRLDIEPGLAERDTTAAQQKDRIAQAALRELPEGGSALLDAGTTTARLAAALPPQAELTVVTHALPIAARLAELPGLNLHLVGGRLRHRTHAAVDAWALRAYSEVHADVLFLAANGYCPDGGLTTPDLAEAAVKRTMVASARRVVLLADSTKYGLRHFAQFADWTAVDTLITDADLPGGEAEAIEGRGPRVVRA